MAFYHKLECGYGWIIILAGFLCNAIVDGTIVSFGLLLPSLRDYFHTSTEIILIALVVQMAAYLCSGALAGRAARGGGGCRLAVMAGGALTTAGVALAVLAPNVPVLVLTLGLLAGTGMGLILMPVSVMITSYFDHMRLLASTFYYSGSGVGMACIPFLALLIEEQEWRYTVLILACITAQVIVLGALLRPNWEKARKFEELRLQYIESPRGPARNRSISWQYDDIPFIDASNSNVCLYKNPKETDGGDARTPVEKAVFDFKYDSVDSNLNNNAMDTDCSSQSSFEVNPLREVPNGIANIHEYEVPKEDTSPKFHVTMSCDLFAMQNSSGAGTGKSPIQARHRLQSIPKFTVSCHNISTPPSVRHARSIPINPNPTTSDEEEEEEEGIFLGTGAAPSDGETASCSSSVYTHDRNDLSRISVQTEETELQNSIGNKHQIYPLTESEKAILAKNCDIYRQVGVRPDSGDLPTPPHSPRLKKVSHCETTFQISSQRRVDTKNVFINRKDKLYLGSVYNLNEYKIRCNMDAYVRSVMCVEPVENAWWKCEVLELGVLKNPQFIFILIGTTLMQAGFILPLIFLVDYAHSTFHVKISTASSMISIIGGSNVVGTLASGIFASKLDYIPIFSLSLTVASIFTLLITFFNTFHFLILYSSLYGFFIGFSMPQNVCVIIVKYIDISQLTGAMGFVYVCRGLASVASLVTAGQLLLHTGGYVVVFYLSAALLVSSALMFSLLPFIKTH